MLKGKPRVAVLGAGIMGCSTALFLARAGCAVSLMDKSAAPMNGASRWNEGKIHLGFLYAADRTRRTAEVVLPGGLAFHALIEELIGETTEHAVTPEPDIYLVHPDSVVDADTMERYFRDLSDRVVNQRGYLAPITPVERLTHAELDRVGGAASAGFRVPERSVNTLWMADRLAAAVRAEPKIQLICGTVVRGATSAQGSQDGPWRLDCEPAVEGEFDIVINALWEGRLAVDARTGIAPIGEWSHRYRLALFVETRRRLDVPSIVLATGPFGDIKNYDRRHFYLSWYPAGLIACSETVEPPLVPAFSTDVVTAQTIAGLAPFFPHAREILADANELQVSGGWVFAAGRGSLADAEASLHRRDEFGVTRHGTYYSVDTGKYSTAPWLAKQLADEILGM